MPRLPSRSRALALPLARITASCCNFAPTCSNNFGKTIISLSPVLSSIPTNAILLPDFVTIVRTVFTMPPIVIFLPSTSGFICISGIVCSAKYASYSSSGCALIYSPNSSRSQANRSFEVYCVGDVCIVIVGCNAAIPGKPPNKSVWPEAASFCTLLANAWIVSRLNSRSARSPNWSNPPDLMSESQAFLLNLELLTRLAKSSTLINFESFRARNISSTAPPPTPFTAAIPKRILLSPGTTANSINDSFTSGAITVIPIFLHSAISIAKRSISSWSLVINAAIKASG